MHQCYSKMSYFTIKKNKFSPAIHCSFEPSLNWVNRANKMCFVAADIPLPIQREQSNDPDALRTTTTTPNPPRPPSSSLQFPYLASTQLPRVTEGIGSLKHAHSLLEIELGGGSSCWWPSNPPKRGISSIGLCWSHAHFYSRRVIFMSFFVVIVVP